MVETFYFLFRSVCLSVGGMEDLTKETRVKKVMVKTCFHSHKLKQIEQPAAHHIDLVEAKTSRGLSADVLIYNICITIIRHTEST